ncbi:hypothetical protein D3C73_1080170 [compost metagenome]
MGHGKLAILPTAEQTLGPFSPCPGAIKVGPEVATDHAFGIHHQVVGGNSGCLATCHAESDHPTAGTQRVDALLQRDAHRVKTVLNATVGQGGNLRDPILLISEGCRCAVVQCDLLFVRRRHHGVNLCATRHQHTRQNLSDTARRCMH